MCFSEASARFKGGFDVGIRRVRQRIATKGNIGGDRPVTVTGAHVVQIVRFRFGEQANDSMALSASSPHPRKTFHALEAHKLYKKLQLVEDGHYDL
jgi:hypothetical protein